ncbi:hypothetical protein BASA50_008881 [Batrachochytrium salamandrivorans]|uniref:Mitotic-spindle organizing protein 1 n=1 Tax=Batrachochytrium salamandrivorans TaxID=1357716 RepID=A0ABQ8F2N8_9FUNG|nr:hypothetical protein BASA62_008301 [Batrachochytrium salamandrivorans]KAH6573715.1 hypothetical protein BASA60_005897 [Batrachochytrium salamandrivorans]KAH6590879.1 hypothetical protein BASA50_008881 [Batrachochytrium salamandrivorans]KAH6598740.1 hypothetical protein BASA61_002815 [Batrachochytrium salamandrivorans]KAH9268334.1 hypothetical protein BASA84_000247 [Batrachochytrium salamandrivorans]
MSNPLSQTAHAWKQPQQPQQPQQQPGQTRETIDILYEISVLLNTGLDREALTHCVALCENGVNPEALAAVIKELKRESRILRNEGAQQ